MPDGGFVTVKSRRKKGRRSVFVAYHQVISIEQGHSKVHINEDRALKRVLDAKARIKSDQVLSSAVGIIESTLAGLQKENIDDTVCYGVGHFTECREARYQLAFLLAIAETFHSSIFIHDPVFYDAEVRILEKLGLNVIPDNEEGKRKIKEGVATLLYLPHCSTQLTNNFLWRNWSPNLENCIFFGNSFSSIISEELSSFPKVNSYYIRRILPHVKEFRLEDNFKHDGAFYDTSLHTFSSDGLGSLGEDFWKDCKEPVYKLKNTEIIIDYSRNGRRPSNPVDSTSACCRDPACEF